MSIPGNHDIGFAEGVKPEVVSRFKKAFGDPNKIHTVGKYDIVLLDTVSLENNNNKAVYEPPKNFLNKLASENNPNPRILLTHVPLYRPENTRCGPLRESSRDILLQKGYQYQNALTPDLSNEILRKVRPKLVLSGDDHDYCRVTHTFGKETVEEITVKSFSAAMVSKSFNEGVYFFFSLFNKA